MTRKHKLFSAKKYTPDHVNYIRKFAQAFDDGSIDLRTAKNKTEHKKLRTEQISRGYDVILDILEKQPNYFKTLDEGIYEYARENNHHEVGVKVNDLYHIRGTSHAKHLNHMIKWNSATDIYYSPTAKSILFYQDSEFAHEYDGLDRDLKEATIRQNDEAHYHAQKQQFERIKQVFAVAFRKQATQDPNCPIPFSYDNKESIQRLYELGELIFDNWLTTEKDTNRLLSIPDTEIEQIGKSQYQTYMDNLQKNSTTIVKHEPNVQQETIHIQPTLADSSPFKDLSINEAAMAYANGWYDGAEKGLDPGLRKKYAEIIMSDGIDAFKHRIQKPSDRNEPLPQKLIDYVGYDTYSLAGRSEESIRLDGQLHFASINDPQLFAELTQQDVSPTYPDHQYQDSPSIQ